MTHLKRMRNASASVVATAALVGAFAMPATSAPLVTGGLVNVTLVNTLNNNEIISRNNVALGVALGIAANVCDVNVNVLAVQLRNGGATCTSTASGQRVDISQAQ